LLLQIVNSAVLLMNCSYAFVVRCKVLVVGRTYVT